MEPQKFSREEADWDEWHKVNLSQTRIHSFAQEPVATDEIRVEA